MEIESLIKEPSRMLALGLNAWMSSGLSQFIFVIIFMSLLINPTWEQMCLFIIVSVRGWGEVWGWHYLVAILTASYSMSSKLTLKKSSVVRNLAKIFMKPKRERVRAAHLTSHLRLNSLKDTAITRKKSAKRNPKAGMCLRLP